MRPLAALIVAALWGAVTAANAQDGFRAPGGGLPDRIATPAVGRADLAPRLVVTPLSGQGLTLSPSALQGAGLRLPPEFSIANGIGGRATFGLSDAAGAALDYRMDRWTFSSSMRQGLAATRSSTPRVDLGASYGFNVAQRHEVVLFGGLGIGTSGALQGARDDDVALRSALDPYRSVVGLRDMGLRLSWRYRIDQRLYVDTSVGFDRNFGDPSTMGGIDRNVGSVGAVFGYRFY